jgi:hypothetical protein
MILTAKWYGGDHTVAIERNGLGVAAVIAAQDTGYTRLWNEGGKPGWQTTTSSRPRLLADQGEGLRDGSLIVRSEVTAEQLSTFVKTATGKPEAAVGCHDDEVMGLGIAYQMALRAPIRVPRRLRKGGNQALHEYDPLAKGDN